MTKYPVSLDDGKTSNRILKSLNGKHKEMVDADQVVEDEDRVPSDGGIIHPPCYTIGRILVSKNHESSNVCSFVLPDKVLGKRSMVLDVVSPLSKRSCCFTKAYGHYSDGTGSVLTNWKMKDVHELRRRNRQLELDSEEQINEMKRINLRYFTPREVARLMCFPEDQEFSFPTNITLKQQYRLLGNSVNVHVIAMLIALMTDGETTN